MRKISVIAFVLSILLAACSAPVSVQGVDELVVEAEIDNAPVIDSETVDNIVRNLEVTPLPVELQEDTIAGALTTTEIDGLQFMREEEKLARDVYLTLYDQWNIQNFKNIAASEAAHMDAVLTLLERYGLEDLAAGKGIGEFSNPELGALFDQLVAQGRNSLSDALKVGAAIEEIDIIDLEKHIAQTDKDDILMVYENLLKGSHNHLRSFTRILQRRTGEIYLPQYLSTESYKAIIGSSSNESGRNGSGNRYRGL